MNGKRKLLVCDCETGGLDPNVNAIISIAALIYNGGAVEDEFYAVINENDGGLIEDGALKVNGFTRGRIEEEGSTPLEVVNLIDAMLAKHDMRGRITVCAHNAAFDMGFLRRLWGRAGRDFSKRFSYRALCTQTGALLLEQAGRINLPAGSASLDNLTKFWNISLDRSSGHNALDDALGCAAVLKKELEMLR
jgi:DNA polymerase III epsilon subunit-like protein